MKKHAAPCSLVAGTPGSVENTFGLGMTHSLRGSVLAIGSGTGLASPHLLQAGAAG